MKKSFLDFLGGPRVKNPPAKCRGHEFSPGSRKIPHARGKLSPCTTTTETKTEPWSPWATAIESTCPRACAPQQEKPQKWEVHALQLEKARRQQQRPRVAKNKYRSFLSKKKKRIQYSVPIFSSHFYSGVCWLLSPTFDSLFSTSEHLYFLLSPSLPNSMLWIFVGVWATENTLGKDYCVDLSLSSWVPPFLLMLISISLLPLLFFM